MVASPTSTTPFPVRYTVDYPETPRNRMTVAFRVILAIPILILFGFLAGGGNAGGRGDREREPVQSSPVGPEAAGAIGVALIFVPALISALGACAPGAAPLVPATAAMVVVRRK